MKGRQESGLCLPLLSAFILHLSSLSSVHPLEEQIGYKFRNSLLLAEALTHPSLGHETQQVHFDNQRLEYLGDAVLQVLFSEHLFRRFPDAGEFDLQRQRAELELVTGSRAAATMLAEHYVGLPLAT